MYPLYYMEAEEASREARTYVQTRSTVVGSETCESYVRYLYCWVSFRSDVPGPQYPTQMEHGSGPTMVIHTYVPNSAQRFFTSAHP